MVNRDSAATVGDLDLGVPLYATDRLDEHFPARIREKKEDFFVFQLKSPLKKGRKLITEDADKRTEIQVSYCRKSQDGSYEVGCQVTGVHQGSVRREWRLPADIPAQVTIVGETAKYKARIVNISPSGLGLHLPVAVPTGSEMTVQMKDGSGYGEVRHCRKLANNKYYAGLFVHEFLDAEERTADGFTGGLLALVRSLKRFAFPAYTRGR